MTGSKNCAKNFAFCQIILQIIISLSIPNAKSFGHRPDDVANPLLHDDVQFYLYTPEEPDGPGKLLDLSNPDTLTDNGYDGNYPLKILCHGFTQNYLSDGGIVETLKPAYLACSEPEKLNVIAVDWSQRSGKISINSMATIEGLLHSEYLPAAQFTESVGQATAGLLNFLVTYGNTQLQNIHLLGHSLGAHSMGFAGQFYFENFHHKVGRITGLDPAGPCFDDQRNFTCDLIRHLQKSDAEFVDVIYTGGYFLGYTNWPIGHTDFVVNGGYIQPNCGSLKILEVLCSHRRVVPLYAESICNDQSFKTCTGCSQNDPDSRSCDSNECIYMGEYVDTSVRGLHSIETNGQSPYSQSY